MSYRTGVTAAWLVLLGQLTPSGVRQQSIAALSYRVPQHPDPGFDNGALAARGTWSQCAADRAAGKR
jgi:hypothetical protein